MTATEQTTTVDFNLTVTKSGSGAGTVTSDVGGIDCGVTCSSILANGPLITLTATPSPGSQFTGWLGPCTGVGTCQFPINGSTTVLATFAASAIGAPGLDIDGVAGCDALTDGLLVIRYLFEMSGAPLIGGAVGPGATRTTDAQIGGYLRDIKPLLDIDGNGETDALTDGILIMRFQFGLRGASVVAGAVGSGATRGVDAIESQIQSLCLPSTSTYTLAVSRTGDGNRTVSSSPGGINCGAVCYQNFGGGTVVTLAGTPGAGSTFTGWGGACSGTGMCVVTMDTTKSVSANFTLAPCDDLSMGGAGYGSAPGAVPPALSATVSVNSASCFGPGVHSSAIDEFGHGGSTLSAPGGHLPPGGGGADVDGRIPTAVDTQTSGSTIYYAVARPAAAGHTVTDNKTGNTYTELDTGNYGLGGGAAWVNATGYCIGVNGGTNHILTTPSIALNEATLGWDEIKQGHVLISHGHVFRASGATQSSPPGISVTGPAWVYVDWFGDGNTFGAEGFVWTVTAVDEGPTVGSQWQVVDSRIVNHNNGWIQWKRWRRYFSTVTANIQLTLASLHPTQGADFYAAAFQETAGVSGAVTLSVPATMSPTAEVTRPGGPR
ncbi:MAG: hypothetical protein IPM02_28295 [Betaproteobacteria bacterium]|nr:hypothetical protein [Betaproteobacteria bacterium]